MPPMRRSSPFPPPSGSGPVRERDFAPRLPLWPDELSDDSDAGSLRRLARLRRALRVERQQGAKGHWAYDLARHRRLLAAYGGEARAAVARGRRSDSKS